MLFIFVDHFFLESFAEMVLRFDYTFEEGMDVVFQSTLKSQVIFKNQKSLSFT